MKTIGARFRILRKENHFNQIEFAKKLGTFQKTISKIECGEMKNIPLTILLKLNTDFKVDLNWLLVNGDRVGLSLEALSTESILGEVVNRGLKITLS